MADNARFHNKYHRRNHHTLPSAGFPDSGSDPIASQAEPFQGSFYAQGSLSATNDLTIGGNALIYGNLSALGNFSVIDTFVTVTSALSVVNKGTGPAFTVIQEGIQDIAVFLDDTSNALKIMDGAKIRFFEEGSAGAIGINTTNLTNALTIKGSVSASGSLNINGSTTLGDTNADTNILRGIVKIADSSVSNGILLGSGDASYDANLYRSTANTLKTDDNFIIDLDLNVNGNTTLGNANTDTITINGTNVSIPNNLNIDSNTLYINSSNDRVGIGTATPSATLTVVGTISGNNLTASFNAASATGTKSFAANEGHAFGDRSFAEGSGDAWGTFSHAEGYNTTAIGNYSHAQGINNEASGYASHAQGQSNVASGESSHAQGNTTVASGESSYARGQGTLASGLRSTATGRFTSATKTDSQASGKLAYANHNRSWVWQGTNLDGASAQFTSTRTDQFAVRPAGGFFLSGAMGINTDNNTFDLYVRKNSSGATADSNSIAVFEGNGNNHISILTPDAQTGGVVFGSPADNFGSYLTWNYGNNALKLATAKTNGFIQLLTNNEAEAVRITSSGNVGIGTTVPAERLTVLGNISASGSTTTTAVSVLKTDAGADAALTILAGNTVGDAASIFFGHNTGKNQGQIRYYNGGVESMAFSTNTVEAMRIRSSGNVGIGTTLPAEKLTVSGNISSNGTLFSQSISSRGVDILHTPANDSINPILRMGELDYGTGNNGFSGMFMSYNESTNTFGMSAEFDPAPGIPAMSIDRNGNVGIGMPTLVPGVLSPKLTVNGNLSALSAVHHIGNAPGIIPALIKLDNFNLLAATGTRVVAYTVPAGARFSTSSIKAIITSTDQSVAFTTAPSISITNGSGTKTGNDLTLSINYVNAVGNVINTSGSYGGGNAQRNVATDTVGVEIVTPGRAGGTQTSMLATIIITGELII